MTSPSPMKSPDRDAAADMRVARNAITALESEKELYRARWLACITPEEGERLRSELAAARRRVAELDSIINYWGGDNDDVVAPEDGERICSEAIARHRALSPLPPGRNEG